MFVMRNTNFYFLYNSSLNRITVRAYYGKIYQNILLKIFILFISNCTCDKIKFICNRYHHATVYLVHYFIKQFFNYILISSLIFVVISCRLRYNTYIYIHDNIFISYKICTRHIQIFKIIYLRLIYTIILS